MISRGEWGFFYFLQKEGMKNARKLNISSRPNNMAKVHVQICMLSKLAKLPEGPTSPKPTPKQ